jgi:phosphoesterase RecJ-like protein
MEVEIQNIINEARSIVILQADNPDADSLASSLALEQILGEHGRNISMYCAVGIPGYLRHLQGWDRVSNELPADFDASVIVDTSAFELFERIQADRNFTKLKNKPCVILDHHVSATPTIDFADTIYIKPAAATGEIIYELCKKLGMARNEIANNMLTTAILSDSLGLTSEGTTGRTIGIISELVIDGVSIPKLENERRASQKKSPDLVRYKARLLERIEYSDDYRVAHITIPWEEIERYSPEYNPSVLVLDEMRYVKGVAIAIAFKTYPEGRITAKIRANHGSAIADKLAATFGGGGHPYAAGFKITSGKTINELKTECLQEADILLDNLKGERNDKAGQYAYTVG